MLILATEHHLAVDYRGQGTMFTTHVGEARVFLDHLLGNDESFIHGMTTALKWSDVVRLDVSEPCPSFEIEWRHGRVADRRRYVPEFPDDAFEMERAVLSLLAHLDATGRADLIAERGWSTVPSVEWEPVETWPRDEPEQVGYRQAVREKIVAVRARPSFLGSLISIDALVDCVTTETHLYGRWKNVARPARIPLASLRLAFGDQDVVYVFGRRTRFALRHRAGCPVREHLDSFLT